MSGHGVLASRVIPLLALLAVTPAWAADVRITVNAVRSDQGALLIGLYDTGDGFRLAIKHSMEAGLLSDRSRVAGVALRAATGSQAIVVVGLKPGRYAVIAFHDENDDGKLDATPWGVPTEGYGFSNDAQGFLSAPSFDAAAFEVGETGKAISVSLTYPSTSSQKNLSVTPP